MDTRASHPNRNLVPSVIYHINPIPHKQLCGGGTENNTRDGVNRDGPY
jgi:hypothetical protein